MSSLELIDTLDFISMYGSSLLVLLFFLMAMFLLRKVMKLPPRVNVYVVLLGILSANLFRLEYYTDLAVKKMTTFIEPNYYFPDNNKPRYRY